MAEPALAPGLALAALDSLTGRLCVLDESGVIVAANRAWLDACPHDLQSDGATLIWGGEGSNYLSACDAASPAAVPAAAAIARGVRAIVEGRQSGVVVPCGAAEGRPAFTARITRCAGSEVGRVVVIHQDAPPAAAGSRKHVDRPGGSALRHRLLANFGQKALQDAQLDDLFTEAVSIAAEGLATEYADISLRESVDAPLVLRAGKGWQVGWIGRSVGGHLDDTLGAAVMRERTAVVTGDQRDDPRIRACALLSDHDVASGLAVPISGNGSAAPVGVLGAYSRRHHAFSAEQADFLQSIAHLLSAVIARHDTEQKLTRLAQFDALTGLPNRSLFQDRLSHGLAQARRHRWHTGVLFVDLDRFKTVNDTLGHDAGDDLLRQAADRLSACVRASDSVGRLAGDEFALVLNNVDWPDDAAVAAQRIVDALARPFVLRSERVHLSASVGVAVFPDDADSPDALMKSAEAAMHASKERGRRGYRFFVPQMTAAAIERQTLEAELREAIEHGQFRLHYQPKASLRTGRICGFEALLRWQHPDRGLVAPLSFIGALEESGLIVPVGEWVISEVCRQIVEWQDAGVSSGPVAVNLSARQFQAKDLDRAIVRRVEAAGVDPSMLEFELTESLLMVDTDEASQVLSRLKAAGFRLALDDFGTGYSSLAYLKRFPLDTLKIDRMFMRDVTADADGASIALAIIKLAQSLKLHVVAEGVESAAQLDFLRAHDCDEMQGYLLSRPLPAADCTRMLVEGRTI